MGKTTDGDGIGATEKTVAMEGEKKEEPSMQNGEKPPNDVMDSTEDPGKEEQTAKGENKENEVGKISVEIREKSVVGDKPETVDQFDSVSNDKPKEKTQTKDAEEKKKSEPRRSEHQKAPMSIQKSKKPKKGIFVSYSPDAGFIERKFVVEMTQQLKENNLADDIWFDRDEKNTDSPCWFSQRMEAVEKCRAAILILSDSYFSCPVSVYEGKALIDRHKTETNSVRLFPILFNNIENSEVPKHYSGILQHAVDLTTDTIVKLSLAEKTSVVIGSIMEDLEKFANMSAPYTPLGAPDAEFTGEYKKKKICQWNVSDLQEWLFKLGIKEFYRQSLAENMVDGFLLMSLTDHDMVRYLGVDSRVVRKKIMQQILQTLDKEHKLTDNWHLRARAQRAKPDVVYIIYDPADVRLAQNLKADLKKKGLQIIHHDGMKLGRSKDEFLQINGPQIAVATHVIVLLTDAATGSPFVFHEVLFADWLGKKLVTAMFKNVWNNLRVSLKAVLGECPAVDFETKMYTESLDVLEHHIKPLRRVPGVVLEQSYLNKMAEGLKPLELLSGSRNSLSSMIHSEGEPQVFISYQWDMQTKVEEIQLYLERAGFMCWADISVNPARGHSSRSSRSSIIFANLDTGNDTLQGQIQRTMKSSAVVLCCITPKYLQSDNCVKDLTLAENYNKPIIPLLLRFVPIENAPSQVKKLLLRNSYIDISNERLFKQNIGLVIDRVKKVVGML